MKFVKFLFYVTYIFLVVWFYKTTMRPWISDAYKFINQKDTTLILGSFPTSFGDTSSRIQLSIIPSENTDIVKLNYIQGLFVNGSTEYENSKLDDDDYERTTRELQMFLLSKFSLRQLKCIGHITLINWENLNDNITGLTTGYDDNASSYIDLPILNSDYHKSLLHEIWHCLHNANYTYFHDNHEYDWKVAEGYVSEYAATNMDEDIAETGSMFSAGCAIDGPKVNIIKAFYKYTY